MASPAVRLHPSAHNRNPPPSTQPATDPPQEKESRSRIRDNQRRSRARRKEYLQELEQRVRQAELDGIHASVEVQAAARQVAEENKKLRFLLRHHGISDSSVETYLASGAVPLPGVREMGAHSTVGSSSSVQRLDHLLEPQKLPPIHSARASPGRRAPESQPSSTACGDSTTCTSPNSTNPPSDDDHNCAAAADL
jgi:hypothetical protein